MKRLQDKRLPLAALILAALASIAAGPKLHAQGSVQQTPEAVADLAMKRFYETLDFGTIWKELYVSNKTFREAEVTGMTFGALNWEAPQPISLEAKERAYVAQMNFSMVMSALVFTSSDPGAFRAKFEEIKETFENWRREWKPSSTAEELERHITAPYNKMSVILRKHVAREIFDTTLYKERLTRVNEDVPADPEGVRKNFEPAGLPPETKIHVVDREMFHFYIIEEQGAFKILTISHRRRD